MPKNEYKLIFWDNLDTAESTVSESSFVEQKVGDFFILSSVGSGCFGKIYHAYDESKKAHYALKVLEKQRVHQCGKVAKVFEEKTTHSCLENEFVIRLAFSFQDKSNLYFAYPFCNGGNLLRYINEHLHFTEGRAKFYIAQIILALEYLHSLKVIHRNLKPEHILINNDGYVKLSGFTFCKKLYGKAYSVCGTPEYFSPEILTGKGYGEEVDWWALGCTLYELITKRTPFQEDRLHILYENIVAGRYKVPRPPFAFSSTLRRLFRGIFEPKKEKRIGHLHHGFRNHSFFREIDFDELIAKTIVPPYLPEQPKVGDDLKLKRDDVIRSSTQDEYGSLFNTF